MWSIMPVESVIKVMTSSIEMFGIDQAKTAMLCDSALIPKHTLGYRKTTEQMSKSRNKVVQHRKQFKYAQLQLPLKITIP